MPRKKIKDKETEQIVEDVKLNEETKRHGIDCDCEEVNVDKDMIDEALETLVSLIKHYNGSKSDAALHCCREIVIWSSETHFEGCGIIAELMFQYRNASDEALRDLEEEREELSDMVSSLPRTELN